MKIDRKDLLPSLGVLLVAALVCYFAVAVVTFKLRHPWATDLEVMGHLNVVFSFGRVSYAEVRDSYR